MENQRKLNRILGIITVFLLLSCGCLFYLLVMDDKGSGIDSNTSSISSSSYRSFYSEIETLLTDFALFNQDAKEALTAFSLNPNDVNAIHAYIATLQEAITLLDSVEEMSVPGDLLEFYNDFADNAENTVDSLQELSNLMSSKLNGDFDETKFTEICLDLSDTSLEFASSASTLLDELIEKLP